MFLLKLGSPFTLLLLVLFEPSLALPLFTPLLLVALKLDPTRCVYFLQDRHRILQTPPIQGQQ